MQVALKASGTMLRRSIPALLGVALFGVMATIYAAGFTRAYAYLTHMMGVYFSDTPFMDVRGTLASFECYRRGIDVIVSNPCDVLGRLWNYPPIWLLGSHLPLDTSLTYPVSVGLDLAFLASLVLVPPARTQGGVLVIVAATLSNSVILALEQANPDLLMFILVLLAGLAALRPSPLRLAAYPTIMLAALLKYYPAVAMIIALRERPVRFLLASAFGLLVIVFYVCVDGPDIVRAVRLAPSGDHFHMMGARTLPYGLQSFYPRVYAVLPLSPSALEAMLSIVAVILAIAMARSRELADAFARLSESERVFLLLGGAILVGCFFAGQSFRYRAIFFLLALPAMTALWSMRQGRFSARLFGVSSVCVVFLMWGYYLGRPVQLFVAALPERSLLGRLVMATFWLGRELVWWWVISVLLAAILLIAVRTETVRFALNLHRRVGKNAGDGIQQNSTAARSHAPD